VMELKRGLFVHMQTEQDHMLEYTLTINRKEQ